MIQAHYSYPALYFYYYYIVTYNEIIIQLTIMLTGGGALAVILAMGRGYKYRRSFAGSPAAHLLLYGPLPNRPRTGTGPWPGGWGPLLCNTEKHLPSWQRLFPYYPLPVGFQTLLLSHNHTLI